MPIAKVGTDTNASGTSLGLSFSHTLVAGDNRMVVVCVGYEANGSIDITGITYGGQAMTKAIDALTGTSGYRFLAEVWYILEADLPANGSNIVVINDTGSLDENSAFCAQYTGVAQTATVDYTDATEEPSPSDSTIENTGLSLTDNAWVVSAVGCGNAGNFSSHNAGQVGVYDFQDASSTFAVAELRGASGETSLSSTYGASANRLARALFSFREFVTPSRNHQMML